MWCSRDREDGGESLRPENGSSGGGSPGWVSGHDSSWLSSQCGRGNRRLSTVSDSGDTGIGTYCSDSMEDDSSSSTMPIGQDDGANPVVHGVPSPSSSPYAGFPKSSSSSCPGRWGSSSQLLTSAMSPQGAPRRPDKKDELPIRRWCSLTKLSSGAEKRLSRTSGSRCNQHSQGSLDRGLLYGHKKQTLSSNADLYLPLSSSYFCPSLLQRSPGAAPLYRSNHSSRSRALETDLSRFSALASAGTHRGLDMNIGALPEAQRVGRGSQVHGLSLPKPDSPQSPRGHRGSPIQPAVRTQMWLTDQMEYRPTLESGAPLTSGPEGCGGDGPCQHLQEASVNQMWTGTSLPINTLVKVKEGLLRQRELEIEKQKQQMVQLHARIRENELRAQQVLHSQRGGFDHVHNVKESAWRMPCQQSSDQLCYDEELGRKLVVAELQVLQLNDFFKQVTQKYTEDLRKLEEKVKTRERYISSLKKKWQRESEQNLEKQQRIETLESYLCDLPTVEQVQAQAQQQEEVEQKAKDLQKTASWFQKSLEEGYALMKDKDVRIQVQAMKEKELMASVRRLQQKVQFCLDDGVRLPMQGLKLLEVENMQLLEQQDHSSRLVEHQKERIERLTMKLTKLQVDEEESGRPVSRVDMSAVGQLLKEMSLCLLDLQALCSILAQRAQGKEPNLALLLDMTSLSVSTEDSDCREEDEEEEVRLKLLQVGQLRRDIDDLKKSMSERYAQCKGGGSQ